MLKIIKNFIEGIAQIVTKFFGSITSLFIHTIVFTIMMTCTYFGASFLEREAYLTNVVSIESIYFSILTLMSINIMSKKEEVEFTNIEGELEGCPYNHKKND